MGRAPTIRCVWPPGDPLLVDGTESYILGDREFYGIAQGAGVWTGTAVRVFGGTQGCSSCLWWDHPSVDNADFTSEATWTGSTYGSSAARWPRQDFGFGWPDDATIGVRGWAAAPLGREWDAGLGRFGADPTAFALVGGTVWQYHPPSLRSEVALVNDQTCPDNQVQAPRLDGDPMADWVGDGMVLQSLTLVNNAVGAPLSPTFSEGLPPLVGVEAAAYGPYSLLAAGGGSVDPNSGAVIEASISPHVYHLRDDTGYAAELIASVGAGLNDAVLEVDPEDYAAYVMRHNGVVYQLRHLDLLPRTPQLVDPVYAFDHRVDASATGSLAGATVDIETAIAFDVTCLEPAPDIGWAGDLSDHCHTDEIQIEIWDPNPDEAAFVATLNGGLDAGGVEVRLGRNGGALQSAWGIVASVTSVEVPRGGHSLWRRTVTYRLPELLRDGDTAVVNVLLRRDVVDVGGDPFGMPQGGQPTYFEFGGAVYDLNCDPRIVSALEAGETPASLDAVSDGVVIRGAVARLVGATTTPGVDQGIDPQALGDTASAGGIARMGTVMGRVLNSDDDDHYRVIVGGIPDEVCATVDPLAFVDPSWASCTEVDRPHLLSDMTTLILWGVEERPYAFGGRMQLVVDVCLDSMVRSDLDFIASGTTDLEFLEERLGAWPLGGTRALAIRPLREGWQTGWGGLFVGGMSLNTRFTSMGGFEIPAVDGAPSSFEETQLHEMAHAWFGYGVTWQDGPAVQFDGAPTADITSVRWAIEGYPTLLAAVRYPNGPRSADRLSLGAEHWSAALAGMPNHDVLDVETDRLGSSASFYPMSAFVAAQLHHTLLADPAYVSDAAVWGGLQAALTDPLVHGSLRDLQPHQLEDAIQAMGVDSFYDDWIRVEPDPAVPTYTRLRKGFPQLGIAAVTPVGADLDVQLASVADDLDPSVVGNHLGVPFYLGCADPADVTDPTVLSCGLAQGVLGTSTLPDRADSLVGVDFATVPVARTDAMSMGSAWLALLSGPQLLPEHVGTYGIRDGVTSAGSDYASAATWLLYCHPDELLCPVSIDSDFDGRFDEEDCEAPVPSDPAVILPEAYFLAPDTHDPRLDENCDGWPMPAIAEYYLGN